MKFIHAADLHLGSVIGLPEFGTTDPALLLWQAYDRLVALCLSEQVDFVLLAGDTFDTDRVSQVTRKRFTDGINKLVQQDIKVFLIHGNHDPDTPELAFLKQIEGLTVFSSSEPQTAYVEGLGVAVHGQSFVKGPINQNLSLDYPKPETGLYNIGMLHTSLSQDGDHARYAPCSLSDLVDKNYDYWALGHIHKAQVFSQNPWVGFCGNLQGRHIREEGARGANLVQVSGGQTSVTPITLSNLEFAVESLSLNEGDTFEGVISQCAKLVDSKSTAALAIRLILKAPASLHAALFDRQSDLREGINAESSAVQSGKVVLKDLKFKLQQDQVKVSLPFDLNFDVEETVFVDLEKALKSRGLSMPELEVNELEAFVKAGLSQLDGEA